MLVYLGSNADIPESLKLGTPKSNSRSCCKSKIILRDLEYSNKIGAYVEIILTDVPKGERNRNTTKN